MSRLGALYLKLDELRKLDKLGSDFTLAKEKGAVELRDKDHNHILISRNERGDYHMQIRSKNVYNEELTITNYNKDYLIRYLASFQLGCTTIKLIDNSVPTHLELDTSLNLFAVTSKAEEFMNCSGNIISVPRVTMWVNPYFNEIKCRDNKVTDYAERFMEGYVTYAEQASAHIAQRKFLAETYPLLAKQYPDFSVRFDTGDRTCVDRITCARGGTKLYVEFIYDNLPACMGDNHSKLPVEAAEITKYIQRLYKNRQNKLTASSGLTDVDIADDVELR